MATTIIISSAFTAEQQDWGPWTVISYNHPGIEGRVKRGEYNEYAKKYHWEFQFRNRYAQSVVFNYGYTTLSERSDCVADHRKHLDAGESSDVTAALLAEGYKVHVCIDDVENE